MFVLSKLKYKEAYLLTCDYHFNSFILKVELCRFTKHLKGGRRWVWHQCSTQLCVLEKISFIQCILSMYVFTAPTQNPLCCLRMRFQRDTEHRNIFALHSSFTCNSRGCGHRSMSFKAKSPSLEPLTQTWLHWQIWICTGCVCSGESRVFFKRGRKRLREREIELKEDWSGDWTHHSLINNSGEICQGWLGHNNVCPWSVTGGRPLCILLHPIQKINMKKKFFVARYVYDCIFTIIIYRSTPLHFDATIYIVYFVICEWCAVWWLG